MTTHKKKNPFSQRKKGAPIAYNGSVEPIPLLPGLAERDTLTLKIKASPQDWDTLILLAEAAPEHLGKLIRFYITRPAYEKFLKSEGSNLPRGLHNAAEQLFIDEARRYAAAAYTVLSHWAKRLLTTWPQSLQDVIREAEENSGKENVWPPGKKSVDVIAIVKCLIALRYKEKIDELGLANTEFMDNKTFRKIYLGKNRLEAAKDLIKIYGDSLTINALYEALPVFPWVYVKE
jgi:hypothetical protein